VTFNGRNMHPMYVSLGNLHASFRQVKWTCTLSFRSMTILQK
jgi:hypothetical protein